MNLNRFSPDAYYRTHDPELRLIGTRGTMALWRHEGRGPRYTKLGGYILYRGQDLNDFLDAHTIEPTAGKTGSSSIDRAAAPTAA